MQDAGFRVQGSGFRIQVGPGGKHDSEVSFRKHDLHTLDHDPFIKSQLASMQVT